MAKTGQYLALLPILRELLRYRSVTHAARALNMSQPAVSDALRRLRHLFDDEILIPRGRALSPSTLAEKLAPRLEEALGSIEALIFPSAFDPATASSSFKIATADYVVLLLGNELARQLAEHAPNVAVEFLELSDTSVDDLRTGRIDFIILPKNLENIALDSFSQAALFDEEFVCVAAAGPAIAAVMTGDEFFARRLVLYTPGGSTTRSFAEIVLRQTSGIPPNVMRVPSFLLIPFLIQRTDNIALIPRRLAEKLALSAEFVITVPPFDIPKLRVVMSWSPGKQHDPEHLWLRQLLLEIAEDLKIPTS
mgnify:CR=1 FL=1